MRGRGRGRFKDRNSPSPSPGNRHASGDNLDKWNHDRYSPEPGTSRQASAFNDRDNVQGTIHQRSRLLCQQDIDRSSPVCRQVKNEEQRTSSPVGGESDATARVRKSERSKNRRPDVQVYVPRARRQQPGPSGAENHASPDRPDGTPKVPPVRQKKKEMERYVPRGRLEQQSREKESEFQQMVNPPTTRVPTTNNVFVESTKNVHKKIKVTDNGSDERIQPDSNSVSVEDVYQNEEESYERELCDSKNVLQVHKVDSKKTESEGAQYDTTEDSNKMPKHTSKYESAPVENSHCKKQETDSVEDIADNSKHLPELCTITTQDEVTDISGGGVKSLDCDSTDVILNFTEPTIPTTKIPAKSIATNKLPEYQEIHSVWQEDQVEQDQSNSEVDCNNDEMAIKESQNLSDDFKDMTEMPESTADMVKDNPVKMSSPGDTTDVAMCSEPDDQNVGNECADNSNGDKLTNQESEEKCSNNSAVLPECNEEKQNIERYSKIIPEADNVELTSVLLEKSSESIQDSLKAKGVLSEQSESCEKSLQDNASTEMVIDGMTDSSEMNMINKCDQSDVQKESVGEQIEITEKAAEKESNRNSVEEMDITPSCDDSCKNQKSFENKDEDLPELIGEQTESVSTDSSKLEQADVIKETENVTIDNNQEEEVKTSNQSENDTENISQSKEEEVDEDSWDAMFDDDGECLDPSAMEELTKTVGKVKIQKSKKINYLAYQPKDKSNFDFAQYEHIIEIYDFPAEFVTRDLIIAFQAFMSRGFDLKWVDDTHALGIFSSAIAANDALQLVHPLLKVCPLSQASKQSQSKAKRCTEFLQPYKPRPETSAMAARRLVAGALGIATGVSREKREMERKQLKEAKAKKRQERQNRENIWEYGKCAMDEES